MRNVTLQLVVPSEGNLPLGNLLDRRSCTLNARRGIGFAALHADIGRYARAGVHIHLRTEFVCSKARPLARTWAHFAMQRQVYAAEADRSVRLKMESLGSAIADICANSYVGTVYMYQLSVQLHAHIRTRRPGEGLIYAIDGWSAAGIVHFGINSGAD